MMKLLNKTMKQVDSSSREHTAGSCLSLYMDSPDRGNIAACSYTYGE